MTTGRVATKRRGAGLGVSRAGASEPGLQRSQAAAAWALQRKSVPAAGPPRPTGAGAQRLGQGNFLEWPVEPARLARRAGRRRPALPQPVENQGRSEARLSGKRAGRSLAACKLVAELRPLLRRKSWTRQRRALALHSPCWEHRSPDTD